MSVAQKTKMISKGNKSFFFALLVIGSFCVWALKSFASGVDVFRHFLLLGAVTVTLKLMEVFFKSSTSTLVARFINVTAWWLYILAITLIYSIFVISVLSWNNPPTIHLVIPYLSQSTLLLHAAGFSVAAVVAGALVFAVFSYYLAWRNYEAESLPKFASSRRSFIVLVFSAAISAFIGVQFFTTANYDTAKYELFTGFFFTDTQQATVSTQSALLPVEVDKKLSSDDRLIFDSYQIGSTPANSNIIIITVDALRADRFPPNNNLRDTAPLLKNRLGKESGVAFTEVRSSCAESMCGLTSIMAGREGNKVGSFYFGLPAVLKKHGYKLNAFLSGDHTNFYGLAKRYGQFDRYWDSTYAPKGQTLNDDMVLLTELGKLEPASGEPNFFFIHLMSAHGLGRKHQGFAKWQPATSVYNIRAKINASPEFINAVNNGYDNGALQADFVIDQVLKILSAKGYSKDWQVIITADHGDMLGEHGQFTHAKNLYEPSIRIPLVWLGNTRALDQDRPVLQADIAPSLLKALNMPIPSSWHGIPVQQDNRRGYSFHLQNQYAALIEYNGARRIKYILDRRSGDQYVFDLQKDAAERKNLFTAWPKEQIEHYIKLLNSENMLLMYECRGEACPDEASASKQ
jgi:glucan phosphoethanolaminetransferase (alkaline phosphatase superfamily)